MRFKCVECGKIYDIKKGNWLMNVSIINADTMLLYCDECFDKEERK